MLVGQRPNFPMGSRRGWTRRLLLLSMGLIFVWFKWTGCTHGHWGWHKTCWEVPSNLCAKAKGFTQDPIFQNGSASSTEISRSMQLRTARLYLVKDFVSTLFAGKNGCPELHVKAADIAVILPFVRAKLEEFPLEGPCTGLLAMVWAADELSGSVMASKTFLTMDQQRHIRTVGDVFLSSYCLLAQEARDRGEYSKISPFDPHGERRSTEQKISGMGQLLYGGGPRATLHSHSSQSKSSDGRENFASSKFCAGEADHAAVLAVNGRVRSRLFAWARKRRSALAE